MSATNTVVETADGWILPLAGRVVTKCLVDFAFTLHFWVTGDAHALIRIGGAFELATDGHRLQLEPEAPTELGPALGLHQREVQRAFAARDGSLEVTFTDGTVLRVLPDPAYEAWEANCLRDHRVIACPRHTTCAPPLPTLILAHCPGEAVSTRANPAANAPSIVGARKAGRCMPHRSL